MKKINPWALKRRPAPPQTKTFRDPEQPEAEFEFTCRRLDGAQQTLALELAEGYVAEWVTGLDGNPPNRLPVGEMEDEPPALSATLCRMAAVIEQMQCGPEESRYGFIDLLGIAVNAPAAWTDLNVWIMGLSGSAAPGGREGNSPSAAG